jgi:hypothetical protein
LTRDHPTGRIGLSGGELAAVRRALSARNQAGWREKVQNLSRRTAIKAIAAATGAAALPIVWEKPKVEACTLAVQAPGSQTPTPTLR